MGQNLKNQLFMEVATQLGVECKIYSPPYYPQSNGRIEGFNNFFKAYCLKHISKSLEWDQVIPLACTAYNFIPNEHLKEIPFFLMFGRDPIIPLNSLLLTPTVRYLVTDENILSLDTLKNIYQLIASNLEQIHMKRDTKPPITDRKHSEGDSFQHKDHTTGVWDPRYTRDYQIISCPGKTQVEVVNLKGKVKVVHASDVKYVMSADRVISKLPDYQSFGRQSRLRIDMKNIPNLKWEPTVTINMYFLAVSS